VKPTLPQTLQDTLQRLIPLPDRDGA
jgi:hypothetical protein